MIIVDKRYTIEFGYAGIKQTLELNESKGKLVRPRLTVHYSKGDVPSIENAKDVDEVLKIISEYTGHEVKVKLINGQPVDYYNDTKTKEYIKSFDERFNSFIEKETKEFFEKVLEPVLKKNKWFISTSHLGMPILIEKNEEGEWDNIKRNEKEKVFNFMCYDFVSSFIRNINTADGFRGFINILPMDYFEKKGYYLDADKLFDEES